MWKSNCFFWKKNILTALIILNIILTIPLGGLSHLVICLGEDGHVALEPIHDGRACPLAKSNFLKSLSLGNGQVVLQENAHHCADFYLNAPTGIHQVLKTETTLKNILQDFFSLEALYWASNLEPTWPPRASYLQPLKIPLLHQANSNLILLI